jgi:hypothetical protein
MKIPEKEDGRVADASGETRTRCAWCGTTTSEDWICSKRGGSYCSRECVQAFWVERDLLIAVFSFVYPPMLFAANGFDPNSQMVLPFFLITGMLWICLGFPALYNSYKGLGMREQRPRNSRAPGTPKI